MSCNCSRGGYHSQIILTNSALELLELFRSSPFLPLAKRDGKPLYIDDTGAERVNSVLSLSLNGLITTDYGAPIKGFDYSSYKNASDYGSMALTLRGQQALDELDIRGIEV